MSTKKPSKPHKAKSIPGGVAVDGRGNIVGNGNININMEQGTDPIQLADAFRTVYTSLEKISDPVLRSDAESLVKEIENEAQKGERADGAKVERWLRFLANIAPDIKDVVVSTLSNPLLGIGTVISKVIAKSKM